MIDRNRAIGRAHSRTSACVRAQHAPPGRFDPTTWMWFTSGLLRTGGKGLRTLGMNLVATPTSACWQCWSSRRDSRHCQKQHARAVPMRLIVRKKTRRDVFGRENPIHRWAPLPLSLAGSTEWGDSHQALGRFAPGGGANRSTPPKGIWGGQDGPGRANGRRAILFGKADAGPIWPQVAQVSNLWMK